MERVAERIKGARQALTTLQELVDKPSPSTVERDATIQRFKYPYDEH